MKKVAILGVGLVLFGMVSVSLVDHKTVSTPAPNEQIAEPSTDAINAAKKALDAEQQVEGVYYNPDRSAQWEIGLVNNGTSRVGYAFYVCNVLKENGAVGPKTKVKIFDVANLLVPGKDRNLGGMGTVLCNDYSVVNSGDLRPVILPSER